jgi:hypothetical protein
MNAQLLSAYQQAFTEPQRGLQRLYEMAKRDQWNVDSQPWSTLDLRQLPRPLREALCGLCCQLHYGEVASMLAAARCVEQASDSAVRMFAATQVVDEARHVEWFTRLIHALDVGPHVAIHDSVSELIDSVYGSTTVDELCVGMQLMVEGLAQTVFQEAARLLRSLGSAQADGPLRASILPLSDWLLNGIARDESRHIAFGVLHLAERLRMLPAAQIDALQRRVEGWGQLLLAIPRADEPRFAALGINSLHLAERCVTDLNLHLRQAGLDVQLDRPRADRS